MFLPESAPRVVRAAASLAALTAAAAIPKCPLCVDPMATVKSDGTHFWPFGLNYVSEYESEADLVGHCALVVAIRSDLGL